jgi:hypothetical protein
MEFYFLLGAGSGTFSRGTIRNRITTFLGVFLLAFFFAFAFAFGIGD